MEFHFLEIQDISSDQKQKKKKKRKPNLAKPKNPLTPKSSVRMFMPNLGDHISSGLALEVVGFSVDVFFQGKVKFVNIF